MLETTLPDTLAVLAVFVFAVGAALFQRWRARKQADRPIQARISLIDTSPNAEEKRLRLEIAERGEKIRELHRGTVTAPRFQALDMHTGEVVALLGSAPCLELHHGPVLETTRPVPGPAPARFYPALVGDLVRDPAGSLVPAAELEPGRCYAAGEPLRFWAPASNGAPVEVDVRALHLYEVEPASPPAVA